ncbi:MAG: hypothetical protein B6U95_00955 [Thermofilum sp. ex4484_82]|nr:hypothetical protein [Thermoproteales archaeon]OYT30365.1 MAG: hypothetical protein B6U95_00955 [Thermofilum sp. ex4484_82]OYT39969.1 MAG: hypothetical protein B6U96_00960 [Archaeoglobales archaeon ex4484_92]RLE86126.1 MAG: hypothetical protein DRJ39_00235 [Thermoprotei archaeon]
MSNYPEKNKILRHVYLITQELLRSTRSRKISIKLRTLLRYAYVSYTRRTTNLNTIRGLVPRVKPPSWLTNQYFYRDIENMLRKNFKASIEVRRQFRYVTLYKN